MSDIARALSVINVGQQLLSEDNTIRETRLPIIPNREKIPGIIIPITKSNWFSGDVSVIIKVLEI